MAQTKLIVLNLVLVELILMLFSSAAVWIWQPVVGKSALLGGAVFLVPNIYSVIYAFRYSGASYIHWIVRSFSWGQTGKLALSGVAFALAFRFYSDVHYGAVFLGFIFMICLHVLVTAKLSDRLLIAIKLEEANK